MELVKDRASDANICLGKKCHTLSREILEKILCVNLIPTWAEICSLFGKCNDLGKSCNRNAKFTEEENKAIKHSFEIARNFADQVQQQGFSNDKLLELKELQQDVCNTIRGLFAVAANAMQCYATYKEKHNLIDFVDQEALLRERLTSDKNFRAK